MVKTLGWETVKRATGHQSGVGAALQPPWLAQHGVLGWEGGLISFPENRGTAASKQEPGEGRQRWPAAGSRPAESHRKGSPANFPTTFQILETWGAGSLQLPWGKFAPIPSETSCLPVSPPSSGLARELVLSSCAPLPIHLSAAVAEARSGTSGLLTPHSGPSLDTRRGHCRAQPA